MLKTAVVAAASKNVVHHTLVWRQLIISQTIHCHGNSAMWPPCYLRRILPATVGMSAMWGVPVPKCALLLCLVFVGECIGKVIKWLKQNYITDASNLTGKAKFVVAVVGPVTILSTDAALESRLTSSQFREHQSRVHTLACLYFYPRQNLRYAGRPTGQPKHRHLHRLPAHTRTWSIIPT